VEATMVCERYWIDNKYLTSSLNFMQTCRQYIQRKMWFQYRFNWRKRRNMSRQLQWQRRQRNVLGAYRPLLIVFDVTSRLGLRSLQDLGGFAIVLITKDRRLTID